MPLTPPTDRSPAHYRSVQTSAWRRADGLWDIEARLRDTKPYPTRDHRRGLLPIGAPIHDMQVRLTIDDQLVVRAVESSSDDVPFLPCRGGPNEFAPLVGERLGKGWRRRVLERFGGRAGCAHLVALLDPIATTAFQALAAGGGPDVEPGTDPLEQPLHQVRKPFFVDGCRSWREDGEVVAEIFPAAAWRRKNAPQDDI